MSGNINVNDRLTVPHESAWHHFSQVEKNFSTSEHGSDTKSENLSSRAYETMNVVRLTFVSSLNFILLKEPYYILSMELDRSNIIRLSKGPNWNFCRGVKMEREQ